ncbi:MAG: ABC transporter substrate-binding protein [Candidatus Bathyarchaeota archaeon]|nr:ABC transporter substrate-binding protein [Candidatus Bathyarchaeota archaeon]
MSKGEKVNRRTFVKAAAGAAIAAAALGSGYYFMTRGPTSQPSKPTIRLGIMMGLTGPYSGNCKKMLDGAMLAVNEVNESGGILGGKQIEAFVRDDELNPGVAIRRATELVETAKVKAIIGTLGTHIVNTLNDYMKRQKKIYMAGCIPVVETQLAENRSPYTYFMLPNTAMISNACADFCAENAKKWYVIFPDYSGGHEMNKYMTERLEAAGCEIIGNVAAPLGTTDFSSFLTTAKAAEPEGLVIGGQLGTDLQNILKQVSGFNMKEGMFVFSMNNTFTDTMAIGLDLMAGVHSFLDFYWKLPYESTGKYSEAYVNEYDELPDTYSIGTYEAVHEWAAAIDRAGTTDSEKVKEELDDHHYDRTKGDEYFRACDGQVVQEAYFVRVKELDEVGQGFPDESDVYEIKGKKEGEQIVLSCSDLGY